MTQVNAHSFPDVYADLGVNINSLGCIMADCEPADTSFIPDDVLYYAKNPEHKYLQGRIERSHVTLRSGLLPGVRRWHVDRVLDGLYLPSTVTIDHVSRFTPSLPDEDPYEVIIGKVVSSSGVSAFNKRLGMLPNVNTFPNYEPHVTLAYVKGGWYDDNKVRLGLDDRFLTLKTIGLNYGDRIEE